MTSETKPKYGKALVVLTTLFFMWGFITCMNDILIPHLKSMFDMNYTQTSLIQLVYFMAYAIMSIPASLIIGRIGYKNGIIMGLLMAGLGALLFYPASMVISYPFFLAAFFVLASGITILQVAANPYVAILGSPETASSRLNLSQAFNSLGTTIAPLLGALLILSGTFYGKTHDSEDHMLHVNEAMVAAYDDASWQAYADKEQVLEANVQSIIKDKNGYVWFVSPNKAFRYGGNEVHTFHDLVGEVDETTKGFMVIEPDGVKFGERLKVINEENYDQFQKEKSDTVQWPYIGIMVVLVLIALIFKFTKLPVVESARPIKNAQGSAWKYPHLTLGAIGIFVYVGAEVAIGSFLVNYLAESNIAGFAESEAAKYVALYWGGAMIGRFQGAFAMSGMKKQSLKYILMVAIIAGGFLLGWWLTGDIQLALIYLGFIVLNAVACLIG